jgi:hypothetical protein
MRISLIGLALLTVLALSACGGSSGSSTSGAAQQAAATSSPTTTSTTTAPTTTTTSSSAATTSAQASTTTTATGGSGGAGVGGSSQQCRASGLALSFLGGQGATGHGLLGFALRNTGTACSTGGYPGIQFLDQAGGPLPTTPLHTTSDFFGHLPLQAISLAPGQTASFRLGTSHGDGSSSGCQTAYGLQVIAPNDTATMRVQLPNGASECGATTVSPLQSGNTAYP